MAAFPQTRWSLLRSVREGDTDAVRKAVSELFEDYWLPMCQFVTWKFSLSPSEAEELVQGFVVDKLLDGHLLTTAEETRGRLRNLLCTALTNYTISRFRGAHAARQVLELRSDCDHSGKAVDDADSPTLLDIGWAVRVLAESLGRMEHECRTDDQWNRWQIFRERTLQPLLGLGEPMGYELLAERVGVADRATAMNLLVSAKRQFARTVHSVLGPQASGDSSPDASAAELCGILTEVLLRGRTTLETTVEQMRQLCLPDGQRGAQGDPSARTATDLQFVARGLELIDEFLAESAQDTNSAGVDRSAELGLSFGYTERGARHTAVLQDLFDRSPSVEAMNSWRPEELTAFLSRQLETPLSCSMAALDDAAVAEVVAACQSRNLLLRSLEELLLHPRPPLELLRMTKDFAKLRREAQDPSLPGPVATAIYFLAIAVARLRCDTNISALTSGELAAGWRWGRDAQWIDDKYRQIFQKALSRLDVSHGDSR